MNVAQTVTYRHGAQAGEFISNDPTDGFLILFDTPKKNHTYCFIE